MPDATVSEGLFMMTGLLCRLAGIVIIHIKSKVLRVELFFRAPQTPSVAEAPPAFTSGAEEGAAE